MLLVSLKQTLYFSMMGKNFSRYFEKVSYFSHKTGLDISCKLSSKDFKRYFMSKIKKKTKKHMTNFLCAEFTQIKD